MTLKTRRILFYGLLTIFLIVGCGAIAYSQGWRLNLGDCGTRQTEKKIWQKIRNCKFKIQKTGAIFIETEPTGVAIKINEEIFKDKSGIIKAGTLISNLFPEVYRVEIIKDGYRSWLKDVEVKSEMVSGIKDVVLVREKIEPAIVSLPRLRGNKIESIDAGGGKFIIKNEKDDTSYLYNSVNSLAVLNINHNFRNLNAGDKSVQKIVFHPFDNEKLIVETEKGIYVLDIVRLRLEKVIKERPLAWAMKGSNIFYIKKASDDRSREKFFYGLYSLNLIVKTETIIAQLPEYFISEEKERSPITKIDASESQARIAFLDNLGDLHVFNAADRKIQKIGHNAMDFSFSPDNKKIAFLDKDGKLNVLFLEDWDRGSPKKAGAIAQFQPEEAALSVFWHKNSSYLFVVNDESLKFMEIDDREPHNVYELIRAGDDNFHYVMGTNSIYFIEEMNLYRFNI